MYDSGSVGEGSVMAYREAMTDATDESYEIHGIVGPARSDAAKPKSILAGIEGSLPSLTGLLPTSSIPLREAILKVIGIITK